ncbi:MAG TPA: chromate efflux transporter [Methanomicrobiales archaeon]|jgi:chromate transporter|nr:chromate efflux transporter [Methanomicrobiales archaeon]
MPEADQFPDRQKPSNGRLFISFLRLGLTAFGGPAMVAYIKRLAVDREHWIDGESFSQGVTFCQMVPGATAIQTAAYVGLLIEGWTGALVSFVGFGLPAFIIMVILSSLYVQTAALPASLAVFRGLQIITVAIIASAALSFARLYLKTWVHGVLAIIAAVLFFSGVSPIIVILLAGLLGYLFLREDLQAPHSKEPVMDGTVTRAFIIITAAAGSLYLLLFFFRRDLFDLAFTMTSVDIFAFGGGFAALPLMFHQVVDVHAWLDAPTFLNGIALGQVTPGPIVITATFVGYLVGGLPGALAATVGMFAASFLLVIGLAPYFNRLRDSPVYHRIFRGILFSFVGLLVSVTMKFGMGIPWDIPSIILGAGTFISLVLGAEILWVVLAGLVISYFMFGIG